MLTGARTYGMKSIAMRLIFLLIALPLATPLAASEHGVGPVCPDARTQSVDGQDKVPRARPLNQMPPAREILTVLRSVDDCSRPVVIRTDIGTKPASPAKAR